MTKPDFTLNGINFVVDIRPGYNRRPSDAEAFTIVKTRQSIEYYKSLFGRVMPRSILELGVFQGGSYALIDQLFQPMAMSAVELAPTPVPTLTDYIATRPGRYVHFGANQADEKLLKRILDDELNGFVDLVVDDASHMYEPTKRSFEVLFPYLSPGGYYIVEDWRWAHQNVYQGPGAPHSQSPALTNLLFDLELLQGSTNLIHEIRVLADKFVVQKSMARTAVPSNFWNQILIRGREMARV